MTQLVERVAAAERVGAATGAETAALRGQVARLRAVSRSAWALLAGAFALLPTIAIDAQNKPARLTVRAPFVVENDSGKAVFIVQTVTEAVKDAKGVTSNRT